MTAEILDIPIKETALYNFHVKLGARLVPFSGYKMPVSYPDGIQSEYFAVRNDVGIFDVSHMGEFIISGRNALQFLQGNLAERTPATVFVGTGAYKELLPMVIPADVAVVGEFPLLFTSSLFVLV